MNLLQDYAAKAMSELLGWYGYGKVDSRCTRGLNLDHFASRPRGIYQSISRQSPLDNHRPSNYTDEKGSSSSSINLQKRSSQSPQSRMSRSPVDKTCTNSKDNQGVSAGTSPKIVENSDSASDTPGNYLFIYLSFFIITNNHIISNLSFKNNFLFNI